MRSKAKPAKWDALLLEFLRETRPGQSQLKLQRARRSQGLVEGVKPALLERLQIPRHPHPGKQGGERPGRELAARGLLPHLRQAFLRRLQMTLRDGSDLENALR